MALGPILVMLAAEECSKAAPKGWQGYIEGDFV